jgi:hypothetical protein
LSTKKNCSVPNLTGNAEDSDSVKWYWPELTDLKESEKAAHEGAGVCFLVAGGTAIIAAMSVSLDKPVLGMDAWAFVDAGIFAIAGWRIWRLSRIWAVLALAMFILESVYAFAVHPLPAVFLIRVTLTLVLLSSVRGTFAYHRFRSKESLASFSATPDGDH